MPLRPARIAPTCFAGRASQVTHALDGRRLCGAKIEQGVEYAEACK